MITKQFKTNINCSGCVAEISPVLNRVLGEKNWAVNTNHKNKILTVTIDNLDEKSLIEQAKNAGFTIETLTDK